MLDRVLATSKYDSAEEHVMTATQRTKGRYPATKSDSVYAPKVHTNGLSSNRIAEDVVKFQKSGGQIEVLGNTQFRWNASTTKATTNGRMPYRATTDGSAAPKRPEPKP